MKLVIMNDFVVSYYNDSEEAVSECRKWYEENHIHYKDDTVNKCFIINDQKCYFDEEQMAPILAWIHQFGELRYDGYEDMVKLSFYPDSEYVIYYDPAKGWVVR